MGPLIGQLRSRLALAVFDDMPLSHNTSKPIAPTQFIHWIKQVNAHVHSSDSFGPMSARRPSTPTRTFHYALALV